MLTAAHCVYGLFRGLTVDSTGCVVPRKQVTLIFGELDARNIDGYEVHKSKLYTYNTTVITVADFSHLPLSSTFHSTPPLIFMHSKLRPFLKVLPLLNADDSS